jgi:hypothetical protein
MMCNENKVTWEDYKKVEKELDEMYIKYATATTASVRMLCACAIEEYHKTLSLMKASLNKQQEGKVKNNNPIRRFFF